MASDALGRPWGSTGSTGLGSSHPGGPGDHWRYSDFPVHLGRARDLAVEVAPEPRHGRLAVVEEVCAWAQPASTAPGGATCSLLFKPL